MKSPPAQNTDLTVIYDSACLLCEYTAKSKDGSCKTSRWIDARQPSSELTSATQHGLNIDNGIVVIYNDTFFFGEEAVQLIAEKIRFRGLMRIAAAAAARYTGLVHYTYPIMKLCRRILMYCLNIPPIKARRNMNENLETVVTASNTPSGQVATDNLLIQHMGEEFHHLAPLLQHFHTGKKHLAGYCCVQRGNLLAHLICTIFHFPKQGERVPLTVDCVHSGEVMQWHRRFGKLRMHSTFSRDREYLVEHLNGLKMLFKAEQKDGALHYRFHRSYFLGVPLPNGLSPKIVAYEQASDGEYCFLVDVRLPVVGKVIAYWGRMTVHDVSKEE